MPAIGGEPGTGEDAFVARLIRPDRQAAEVLRLFEGARWSDPAAALAAWKEREPGAGLGKFVEAIIALVNPEMAGEWRCLDGAEFRLGPDHAPAGLGWFALVPRDDGTVAAAITAMRLTHPDGPPLIVDGRPIPVARRGRSGIPLACQVGPVIVVAGSREALERGVAIARTGRVGSMEIAGLPDGRGSGTVFHLEPARMPAPRDAPPWQRRAIEAMRASGCRRTDGVASLKDGVLVLDVASTFESQRPGTEQADAPIIETTWLEALPSDGLMAMISMAVDPSAWDRAFAAADRIERADPARAGVAPLRSRLNLLAMAAALNLEADVRPHLRGLSAGLIGDPDRPGRVDGAVALLHLDDPAAADRIVRRATPRLVAILGTEARARAVSLRARDRDVRIAWGNVPTEGEGRPARGRSLATLCGGWGREGRKPPVRVVAIWPGRIWQPAGMTGGPARVLADEPPVLWWGWSEPGRQHDLVRWAGLGDRVRSFLAALPGETGPLPEEAGLRVGN